MRIPWPLWLALLGVPANTAAAQQLPLTASLHHRIEGSEVRAAIELRIAPGWHVYHDKLGAPDAVGNPTRVTLSGEGIEWGPVEFPTPVREEQPGLAEDGGDTWIWAHEGRVVLRARGTLAPGTLEPSVRAQVKGQVCEGLGLCQPLNLALESKGPGPDELFAELPGVGASEEESGGSPAAPVAAAGTDELGPARGTAELRGRFWLRREGAQLLGVIRLEIKEGWHLYHDELAGPESFSLPTRLEMKGEGVRWGEVQFPEPERHTDDFGTAELVHSGTVDLRVSGDVQSASEPTGLSARILGQVCSNVCLPVDLALEPVGRGPDAAFSWSSEGSGAATATTADAAGDVTTGGPDVTANTNEILRQQSKNTSLLAFLLLAVGGGLFALLMPCTYPMIPITISFFTKQADARGGKVLPLALAYGAGIVLIFVLIGVAVGPVILAFATHPVTNLAIGLLFLLFAAALFGAVNLQPPRFLMDAAGRASMHGGYFGVFLMGATLVVSSFTCTAPFVGSLLSVGAVDGGGLGRVALGMGVFGLTMAVPFVLLSLLPGRVQAIPQSGEWMNTLKVTLGFVEIAAALKFISNSDIVWGWQILSLELFLLLWAAIFLLCAIYLFGWIKLQGHAAQELTPGRMTAGIAMLLFALYCWHGMKGGELDEIMTAIVPPYSSYDGAPGGDGGDNPGGERSPHQVVIDDYEAARAAALADGKLLFVNFTGWTCVNCRLMEKKRFPAPAVAAELERMVEARLHNDGEQREEIKKRQLEMAGSLATPLYLVVEPVSERVLGRHDGATSAEVFALFLRESASRAKVAMK